MLSLPNCLSLNHTAKIEITSLKSFLKNQEGDATAPNQYKFLDRGGAVGLPASPVFRFSPAVGE